MLTGLHIVGWPLLAGASLLATRARDRVERLFGRRTRTVLSGCFAVLHLSVAAILCYVVFAVLRPGFTEWVESIVVAVAKYWAAGGTVYPVGQALKKYGVLPYGPLLFQSIGTVYRIFAESEIAVKAIPIILVAGTYGLMFAVLRRLRLALLPAVFSMEFLFVIIGIMGFMVKADIMLISIAACACFTVYIVRRQMLAGVLLAILAGLATAIKLHGAFYVLPAAVECLAIRPGGWLPKLCAAAALALAVALAPFLVPGTSLYAYIHILRLASHDGLLPGIFISNMAFIGMMALCVHVLSEPDRRDAADRRLMRAILAAGFFVSIFAAKSEAGPHHLIPFLPYLCAPFARAISAPPRGVEAFLFILFLLSFQPISSVAGDIVRMLAHWHTHAPLI